MKRGRGLQHSGDQENSQSPRHFLLADGLTHMGHCFFGMLGAYIGMALFSMIYSFF